MTILVRGTDTGFELQMLIQWRSLIGFVQGLIVTITTLLVLLSTPVGQVIMAWLGW